MSPVSSSWAKVSASSSPIWRKGPYPWGWKKARTRPGCAFSVRRVAAHFSGLCPKSSITVTPLEDVPTISKRRARPLKPARAATASATGTPAALAPAIAASALERLCLPGILQDQRMLAVVAPVDHQRRLPHRSIGEAACADADGRAPVADAERNRFIRVFEQPQRLVVIGIDDGDLRLPRCNHRTARAVLPCFCGRG